MRWWLNTDHKAFAVDNAVVKGMDFSALPPELWMVQWQDGKGEIENQIDKDTNDNGLRENFIDVVPYAPYFQDFLRLVPYLTLPQAKKVQIDLIRQIFESKRQAPFHYPIAAGDYWWDATDETLFSSTIPAIQNATNSINQVIAALNAAIAHINSNLVGIINQNAGYGNTLVAQVNSNVVAPTVAGFNTTNGQWSYFDATVTFINDSMFGTYGITGTTTVNGALRGPDPVGLAGDVPKLAWWAGTNPYQPVNVAPGTFNNATAVPYVDVPPVSVANAQWIPIGATTPVTVTPAEQAGIMNGIAARTNALSVKKNIKIGEVNVMTTLDDVINYDVTTGW